MLPDMPPSTPQGYYAASANLMRHRPMLSGEGRVDVCVVGAGFTGLSAALHLASQGARVMVLEAETVAFAASGRNGGQIHTGLRKNRPLSRNGSAKLMRTIFGR